MQGASSLDAAMQLAEQYDAIFSKQQVNPDPQNAGQAKGHNPKKKAPKLVNRARAVQVVLLLVQTTSVSPHFLENV